MATSKKAKRKANQTGAVEPMAADEFERTTVELALAGDAEAGFDALELCAARLVTGALSEHMRFYLSERLRQVVEGVPPAKALCIAREKIKPTDPFPDWEMPLAAFAALMTERRQ